jgi:hypothetical protein
MQRYFTPAEVSDLIGVSPENLRDWRRRGLIDSLGALATPTGWTTDPDDPALAGSRRATWGYRLGDVTALATARQLQDMGLDLSSSLQVAEQLTNIMLVRAFPGWAAEHAMPSWVSAAKTDFVAALQGRDTDGIGDMALPVDRYTVLQITDLAMLPQWIGTKALVLNVKRLAEQWPEGVKALFSEEGR